MSLRRLARRLALLPALTAGVLAAAVVSPPGAQASEAATCTSVGGVLDMSVNHPVMVSRLELLMTGSTATVSVNGSPIGSCDVGSHTQVRMIGASAFDAWQVSDASSFLNASMQPARFLFGGSDPVVVVHGNPDTAASWRGTTSPYGVDLDGNGVPDITTDMGYAELTLVGSENNDTIDLAPNPMHTFQGNSATIRGEGGNDTLRGGAQRDVIEGGFGNDHLEGWDGPDTLVPGEDTDQVFGRTSLAGADDEDHAQDTFVVVDDFAPDQVRGDGDDAIEADSFEGVSFSNAGTGDDGGPSEGDTWTGISRVTTGSGDDWIQTTGVQQVDAGAGEDTVVVGVSGNGLLAEGGAGIDTLDLSQVTGPTSGTLAPQGAFVVPTFPQNLAGHFESMVGGSGVDTWTVDCACTSRPGGGADQITFTGGGGTFVADPTADGADTVSAEEGVAMTVDYSQRSTAVSLTLDAEANDGTAGEGDDLSGASTLRGGSAGDTIVGDAQPNQLEGGPGNDALSGRGGNDRLLGEDGADRLTGGSGSDRLLGGPHGDRLLGGDGDDLLHGDAATDPVGGNDLLDGGAGDDDEFGHRGNDTFQQGGAANGQDLLAGGAGTDLASYALRGAGLRLSLNGAYDDGATGEGDRINGDVENLTGGRGADVLTGNGLANRLTGGLGRDTLSGLGGNDTFLALDRLVDSLFGGTGTDRARRDGTDRVNSMEQRF